MKGSLEMVIGPMFAGKSTELMRQINRDAAIGLPYAVVNHHLDSQRYQSPGVSTHPTAAGKQTICASVLDSLMPFIATDSFREAATVYINEAQFFPDLLQFVKTCVVRFPDKRIVICGLDGDSSQEPFKQVVQCIPYADKIRKLLAQCIVCKDGTLAPYTIRRGDASPTRVRVGGAEMYSPVCRSHLLDPETADRAL